MVSFLDFDALWAEHVRNSDSERMKDDEKERAFWKSFIAQRRNHSPDPSSRFVLEKILPVIHGYEIETGVEMGPGWGNYTLDLAKECKALSCVDISRDILDYILKISAEQGLANIRTIHAKWEDFSADKEYDLAFGYNCFYRQRSLKDCFARLSAAAKKLCMAGMNSGPLPPWTREMAEEGAEVKFDGKDYIYFVNVLYQMGYLPQLMVLPFEKPLVYESREALFRNEVSGRLKRELAPEKAMEILEKYFQKNSQGFFTAKTQIHCGIVWWEP